MEEEHIYKLPNLKEAVASWEGNSQYQMPSKFTPVSVSASAAPHQDKSKLKKPVCSWLWICALVGFILVGSAAFASLALTVWNISQVNHQKMAINDSISNAVKFDQIITMLQIFINSSKYKLESIQVSMNDSTSELERQILQLQNSVNDHNEFQSNISRSLSSEINNIIQSLSGQYSNLPAVSCSQILLLNSSSPSGHYWIRSSNGSAVRVYCDLNRQCGCDGPSGWTRVAFLNMSDPNQVCPGNWTTIASPVRTCSMGKTSGRGCNSVFYSTYGMTYTRVCGRIIAYQHGIPDAFNSRYSINETYIDGVSLTHGSDGSWQHIWSFVSAGGEGSFFESASICACSSSNPWPHSTSFVGDDYFCDSGNHANASSTTTFYSDDPLWDGQGCGPSSACCHFNNPPWFCKTLPHSTTDDLEVRICKNYNDEDIPIQLVELYVQ